MDASKRNKVQGYVPPLSADVQANQQRIDEMLRVIFSRLKPGYVLRQTPNGGYVQVPLRSV